MKNNKIEAKIKKWTIREFTLKKINLQWAV